MPNWCECDLTLNGPNVPAILAAVQSDNSQFDFDTLIPYPQEYRLLDERSREYSERLNSIVEDDPERDEKLAALAVAYGVELDTIWLQDGYNSGGYEWCIQNWGTKWSASEVVIDSHPNEPHSALIHFDVPWCPPLPVVQALAEKFPGHEFLLEYYEGGIGFCGEARWNDGVLVSHRCEDYDGERGG